MTKSHISHRVATTGGQHAVGIILGLVTNSNGFLLFPLESLIGYSSSQLLSTKADTDCEESCHGGLLGAGVDVAVF